MSPSTRHRWLSPDLAFIFRGSLKAVGLMSVLSIIGAVCETFLLAIIAQSATALSQGKTTLSFHRGPIHVSSDIDVLLGLAVGAAVVRGVLAGIVALMGPRITARTRSRCRRAIFSNYLAADWGTQAQEKTGRLMQTFSTSVNDATGFITVTTQAIPAVFTLVTLVGVALLLNPAITGGITLTVLAISAGLYPIARRATTAAKVDALGRQATAAHVAGSLTAGAEITVLGARSGVVADADRRIDRAERAFGRAQGFKRLTAATGQSIAFVLAALGVWSLSLSSRHVDFALVGTIAILLLRGAGVAQQVQGSFNNFSTVRPFVSQVRTMIEFYGEHRLHFGDAAFPASSTVTLDEVTYTYPGSTTPALDVDHVRFPEGQFVGVMGPSGSGKSTLIQVLLRLRPADAGHVRIGGVPIGDISEDAFSSNVAYVPQSPHLVTGTILDNIRFFRDHVSDDDCLAAAVLANVHDDILGTPSGYGTVLDGHVDALSGGQRQRLALARALAGRPRLLVLDEPTSALDAANEAAVVDTLAGLRGETTVIMITHKLSTVSACDAVYHVERGQLHRRPPTGRPDVAAEAPGHR